MCDELFFRCNSHIKIQLYICELSYLKKNVKFHVENYVSKNY